LSFENKNPEKKLKFYFEQKNSKLKIIHSRKKNLENRLLCFGNENPEKNEKLIPDKKNP